MAKKRKSTSQVDITNVLHIVAIGSPQEISDLIQLAIDELERLRQIESLTLELLAQKADSIELTLDHPICIALLELTVDQ